MTPQPISVIPQPVTVGPSSRWVRRAAGSLLAMPVAKRPVRRRLRSSVAQSGCVVRAWKCVSKPLRMVAPSWAIRRKTSSGSNTVVNTILAPVATDMSTPSYSPKT